MSTAHTHEQENWTEVIEPRAGLLELRLGEVWRYRDLVLMFVRRDFVAFYKQTILGPIWFFLQPLLTTLTYFIIFGRLAGLQTDGMPAFIFYLAGITMWNYFSECLTKTSTVFKDNASIFGKVYFPRLTMPLSIILSNLIRFGIQFSLFIVVFLYYWLIEHKVQPNIYVLLVPVLVLLMALLSLGLGMIISALTSKYKDLVFLVTFGVQLLMYVSGVIIPVSQVGERGRMILLANPATSLIETFRFAFLGKGYFSWWALGYTAMFTGIVLMLGMMIFNRIQRSFMDTV